MQQTTNGRAADGVNTWNPSGAPESDPSVDVEGQIALLPRALIRQRMADLRRHTLPAHDRLDAQVEADGWLRSVDGYRALLERFYGLYQPLEALLREAVRRFDLTIDVDARRKSHLIAPETPVTGWWDGSRIGQVLDNLISNAIKYSPDGGEVAVRVKTGTSEAQVEVEDQGIGIPADVLPRLFDQFYRVGEAPV
jgi:signal transduction histidine kinase